MPTNLKFSKKGLVTPALLFILGLLIVGCADDDNNGTKKTVVVADDNNTVVVTLDRPPSPASVFTF
jgi:ABC-type Fe3+-citrate transport system substrate-binding protein